MKPVVEANILQRVAEIVHNGFTEDADAGAGRVRLRSVAFFRIFRIKGERFPQLIAGLYDTHVEGI